MTSNLIDLAEERDRRDGPDEQFRTTDRDGMPMLCFSVDFAHDGARFSFHIWAYDFADAQQRVWSIRDSAAVAGQVLREIL